MKERNIRLICPLFLFAFLLIFFYGMFIHDSTTALMGIGISAFYAVVSCESSFWIIQFSRKKFPGIAHTNARLKMAAFSGFPTILLISFVDHIFTQKVGLYSTLKWEDYIFITGLNIMCFLIILGIYEGFYYIKNWKLLIAESEEIKKINLTNQFQLLKEQVKPHFLFNSLNTLISLIRLRPDHAIRFTEELSSVYRYLLRKNLRELSTVREELEFIRLYISMMETRFQDSLIVNIEVAREDEEASLPPFVLQLLVENAIKHNVVSSEHPLIVSIESTGDSLTISNNLQKKRSQEPSEKTGLLNLIERYKLLKKDHLLEIIEDEAVFRVTLPLIRTSAAVTVV